MDHHPLGMHTHSVAGTVLHLSVHARTSPTPANSVFCVYTCAHVRVYVCTHACVLYVRTCVRTCVCVPVHVCTCVCVNVLLVEYMKSLAALQRDRYSPVYYTYLYRTDVHATIQATNCCLVW